MNAQIDGKQNYNMGIYSCYLLELIEKAKISNLSIYFAADNLFCLSARQGYIPMASFFGSSSATQYTPLSSIMGGLKISF